MTDEKKRFQKTIDFKYEDIPILDALAIKAGYTTKNGKPKLGAYVRASAMAGEGQPAKVKGIDAIINQFKTVRKIAMNFEENKEIFNSVDIVLKGKDFSKVVGADPIFKDIEKHVYQFSQTNEALEDILKQVISQFKVLNNNLEKLAEGKDAHI
jgi:hypothetical protein